MVSLPNVFHIGCQDDASYDQAKYGHPVQEHDRVMDIISG